MKKEKRLRLSIFRSNQYIYAQIIDDEKGHTLVSCDSAKVKKPKAKMTKIESAKEVGRNLATLALAKNIKKVTFDRGKFRYHGRIKSLAEGAREGGLDF